MESRRAFAITISLLLSSAATPFLAGCRVPPIFRDDDSKRTEELYANRLAEIDRLADLGRIREAIELARRALVDHYYSEELRDRLGELVSIRQVMFDRNMKEADERLEAGAPRTAVAILDEIDRFGDEAMMTAAHEKRDGIYAAHPAIFSSEER